jgi:multiple sugar transport system permease protein/cellobiose transport system permease protein
MAGLKNYEFLLFKDPYFWKSVWNTFLILFMSLPVLMATSFFMALGIHSKFLKGRRIFQVVNFLPFVTTMVAIGVIFALLFDWRTGFINQALMSLGIIEERINWLGKPGTARLVVSIARVWRGFGYWVLLLSAGISSISVDIEEAAIIDGAGYWRRIFSITLPILRPIFLFLTIMGTLSNLQLFEEPSLLFSGWVSGSPVVGGPDRSVLTIVWHLYETTFHRFKYGMGGALSIVLFGISALVSYVNYLIVGREHS